MPKVSAGLLMYRVRKGRLEVLLVHPGGPFWAKRDLGSWTIPKGELDSPEEDPQRAALREFREETGLDPGTPRLTPLGEVRQKSGKVVHAWAFEGDCDTSQPVRSNTCRVAWPPKSGKWITVPEVDRLEFFGLPEARQRINLGQVPLLDRLADLVGPRQDAV